MDANTKTIETFADLLHHAMNERGVPNMAGLARGIGVTQPAVLRWMKKGNLPTDIQLAKLSGFLGVGMDRFRRARDLQRLIQKAPSLEHELRLVFHRRENLGLDEQPMVVYHTEKSLPLINPRQLPTEHQKFRIDPHISCGLMGPVWAVCDQCLPVMEGALTVVLVTKRRIRFDRYDGKLYKGLSAYRVTAILPKE